MLNVGILGATGYSGQELIRLLKGHREVNIRRIISDTYCSREYSFVYRNFIGFIDNICEDLDWTTLTDDIELLFSALPYGVLMKNLTVQIMQKVKIIDIGVDYRFMNRSEYKEYYGKEHESIELEEQFVYGLCEWNEDKIKNAGCIANPGCYSTAVLIALLPLIREDIIDNEIIIDGKCGLSGGGRTLTLGTHFAEANESTKAYKLTNHPHGHEIKKGIEYFTGKNVNLTFTPHIVPMQRGMLITAYTRLKDRYDYQLIKDIYLKYYSSSPFIRMLDRGIYVETKWIRNSNMCHINFEINEETGKLIVVAAIDNLIKGAAGQAVQNMNIMMGYPQDLGLDHIPVCI